MYLWIDHLKQYTHKSQPNHLVPAWDIATHRPYRLCISSSASSIKQTLPFSISAIPFEISVTNCFLVSLRIVSGSFAVNFISKGIPLYITTASKTYRLHWIQKYRVDPPPSACSLISSSTLANTFDVFAIFIISIWIISFVIAMCKHCDHRLLKAFDTYHGLSLEFIYNKNR